MKKIAIACQGGGAHTAFTAGALKRLLERDVHKNWEIVGLSGTSGGAICATTVWISLLEEAKGSEKPVYERLMAFWKDNSALNLWERSLNNLTIEQIRLQDKGFVPSFAANPYSSEGMLNMLKAWAPRKEYMDFAAVLQKHIPFQEIETLVEPSSPTLLLGAVDVLSGRFKTFNSTEGEISVEAMQASAGIPEIFKAIQIGNGAYWDGLFSENPPVGGLVAVDNKPEEIWVIQINPSKRSRVPDTSADIADRRNELAGNLSMFQEVRFIEMITYWIESGAFTEEFIQQSQFKPVKIRFMAMSNELSDNLDYASKLDRDPCALNELIADGEKQADDFLNSLLVDDTTVCN